MSAAGHAGTGASSAPGDDRRETALLAANAAGEAIRPFFRALDPGLALKPDRSPVTRADHAAEAAMRAVIAARHPDDAILGEEGGATGAADARWRWVLDPIDGTRAFITGRPTFATLVAVLHDGVPVLGLIDQPVTRERWFGAGGDSPTTVFLDPFAGATARDPAPFLSTRERGRALAEAELSATTPAMFLGGTRARFERLAACAGRVSWGGDAYAYGLLAMGQIDVIAEASMKLWDWAALVPVVEGAGGVITDWSGATLRADGDGTVLAAGTAELHAEALAALGD